MNKEAILRGFYKRADEIAQAIKSTPYDDVLSKVDFGITPKVTTPSLMQKSDTYNNTVDSFNFVKGMADPSTIAPVSKMAPSKMVAPFYGNKYNQEVNKAVKYNEINQTVPYNLKEQLNTPVSIRGWPMSASMSRVTPDAVAHMGTRYFPPEHPSAGKDVSVHGLLDKNESNALFKNPKYFNTIVGHEVGHALYPPFRSQFWYAPDNTRNRMEDLQAEKPAISNERRNNENSPFGHWHNKYMKLEDEKHNKFDQYRKLVEKTKTTNPQLWEGELNPIARKATHDADHAEVINYLGEIQRNKFLTEGKRFEAPEEYSSWMDGLTQASTEEPLKDNLGQRAVRGMLGKIVDNDALVKDHMFTPNQDKMNSTSQQMEANIKDYPLELKRHLRMMNYLRTTNPKEYERIKGYSSKIIPGLVNNNNKTTPYIS